MPPERSLRQTLSWRYGSTVEEEPDMPVSWSIWFDERSALVAGLSYFEVKLVRVPDRLQGSQTKAALPALMLWK